MLNKKKKIIFIIFIAICTILLFNSNFVQAAINEEYSAVDDVLHDNVNEAVSGSDLIDLLARLVFAVGMLLEWLLSIIFKLLTGVSDFPWADKIVFNAVPLLDVNFINPAQDSFVLSIQVVLQSVYSTILTLAVGFFGIAVLITAIKLVISTIASEKAKYKKAIVDWAVGFVMIFCIHYFISFVFYLNEQLVTVASRLVTTRLENANDQIVKLRHNTIAEEIINDARSSGATYGGRSAADILQENATILDAWINKLESEDSSMGINEGIMKSKKWWTLGVDTAIDEKEQYERLAMIMSWAADTNASYMDIAEVSKNIKVAVEIETFYNSTRHNFIGRGEALLDKDAEKLFGKYKNDFIIALYSGSGQWDDGIYYGDEYKGTAITFESSNDENKTKYYVSSAYEYGWIRDELEKFVVGVYGTVGFRYGIETQFYWSELLKDLYVLKSVSRTASGEENGGVRIISDLGSYFKENAYAVERRTTNKTAVTVNKDVIKIENMLMYAILIGQSLILFIAYIKRLFYVIILAMMAPVVVVFDFFQKFGK